MKSTIEEKGSWERAIAIELDADEVGARIDEAIRRVRRRIQLPGFRKGKVPVHVVESRYWETIRQEVLQTVVPEAVNEVLAEHELRVASQPRIEDLSFEKGEPLTFTALVELWPEIEAPDLAGMELDEELFEIEEEDIEKGLDSLRDELATLEPVEGPSEEGDLVEALLFPADRTGNRLPGGKRQELRMEAGAENLLPEFREASIGIGAGEQKLVHVRYPEAHRDRNLAGSQRYYLYRAAQVLRRNRPDLDDSLAGRVEEGLDLSGLRQKVRERLAEEEAKRARRVTQAKFIARMAEAIPFEVPRGVIEDGLRRQMERIAQTNPNVDPQQARQELLPQVEVVWKRRLILDAFARKEAISISDDEVDERIREHLGDGVNVARVRERLTKTGEITGLRLEVLDDKVFEKVFETVEVKQTTRPRPREEQAEKVFEQ